VGRNFSRLALALVIFAAVFLPSTRSVHSTSGGRIATDLVETTAGVYASSDCASGWWEQGGGTDGLTIYSLMSHSGSPKIYAGLWGEGVYITPSGANSWSQTSLMPPLQVTSLAIDPASPASIVYAGTKGSGIFRSDSGGANWGGTGLEDKEVWSLAVASTVNPIYAYAGVEEAIYISTDGIRWDLAGGAEIGTERFYALVVDPQDSTTAYVGTKGKGVHQTTDGGISWTPRGLGGKTVRALAFHPGDGEIIYAGTQSAGTQSSGIFKSTDGGASWPASGLVGQDVMAIAVNPRNPEFVYAATFGDGVWASYDGGDSWHRMSGLTSEMYSLTLFTPEGEGDCQVLYAGTTDGVWARAVTSFYTSYLPLVYKDTS
jgi:hypothetical protein